MLASLLAGLFYDLNPQDCDTNCEHAKGCVTKVKEICSGALLSLFEKYRVYEVFMLTSFAVMFHCIGWRCILCGSERRNCSYLQHTYINYSDCCLYLFTS